jgi:hypothetical protein
MHVDGILMHAAPVPLEGEQNTAGDPDSAENAPTVQQTRLPWRQRLRASIENLLVMQQ